MSIDNLALNKKGTKVVIIGKPKYYNLLGTVVQWLPSFLYIAFKFGIFTFEDAGYALTGMGIIGVSILFLMLRSKLKEAFKQYEEMFGETWGRIKLGNIALSIATVLFGVYLFSFTFFIIFFIFAGSTYASLYFYIPYDKLYVKRKEMQVLLNEKIKKEDFAALELKLNELQSATKTI